MPAYPAEGPAASLTHDDGASVLDTAVWNQFGVPGHIPARPFMDQANERIIADGKEEMAAVVRAANRDGFDPDQALRSVAAFGVKCIREAITDGDFVPNAPRTVRRKKSKRPLIDTGKLRQSASAVIRDRTE